MRASNDDLAVTIDMEGFQSRQATWGDCTVALETLGPADYTEAFSKLPGGHCSCPHWGYVVSGRLRIKYVDREEVLNAGDAYYMEPGHVPVVEEDSVLVEFSPTGEYEKTMAALGE